MLEESKINKFSTGTMNKEFEYRSYKFNIKVELNTKVEKKLNGDRWHTVTTNCMGADNYYKKEKVNDRLLVLHVISCESDAKKYVDEKLGGKPSPNEKLSELGFK